MIRPYLTPAYRTLICGIMLLPGLLIVTGCRAVLPMDLTAAGAWRPAVAIPVAVIAGWITARLTAGASFQQLLTALLTALLPLPFVLTPSVTIWSTAAAVAGLSWTAYRVLLLAPALPGIGAWCRRRITPRAGMWIVTAASLTAALAAFAVYREAVLRQYLFWEDWGIFNETAWNTLHGRFMACDIHYGENFFGDHFMPGFYLVFLPLLALIRSPLLLPGMASLALYGSAILVYRLARVLHLKPATALIAAAAYLLYPVTANLNLSGLYGSHVITFLIPVMLAFAIAFYSGRRKTAFALFLFSLTIKESVAVLWVGWALIEMIAGRRKFALSVLLTAAVWFALVTGWIIPAIAGEYRYTEHYQELGGSTLAVILSPLLRPAAFWGTLATRHNLLLIVLLIVPLFPVLLRVPRFVPAALVAVVINMLRGNPAVVNLAMHHNTECLALLSVLTAIGLAHHGRLPGDRLLAWGLPDRAGRRLMARSAALLLTALLGHWFYAQSFGNCVSVTRLLGLFPRKPELVDAVLTEIPPGATVAADRRSATMVMFRNRIVPLDRAETADYVYYNRRAGDAGGALHRRLLNDPAYGPVFRRNDGGGAYWLFRRGAPRPAMPTGEILDDAAWQQQPGEPLDCGNPAFSIKVLPVEMNGRRYLRFAARKNAPAGDDGEFQVTLRSGGSTRYFSIFYGNGLRAAGDAQIGEVFVFGAEIPDAWASLDGPPEIIYRKI